MLYLAIENIGCGYRYVLSDENIGKIVRSGISDIRQYISEVSKIRIYVKNTSNINGIYDKLIPYCKEIWVRPAPFDDLFTGRGKPKWALDRWVSDWCYSRFRKSIIVMVDIFDYEWLFYLVRGRWRVAIYVNISNNNEMIALYSIIDKLSDIEKITVDYCMLDSTDTAWKNRVLNYVSIAVSLYGIKKSIKFSVCDTDLVRKFVASLGVKHACFCGGG